MSGSRRRKAHGYRYRLGPTRSQPSPEVVRALDVRRQEEEEWRRQFIDHDALEAIEFWKPRFDRPTFVYFIQERERKSVKIGLALNPQTRRDELQCGNPDDLHIRAVILGSRATEDRLHRYWTPALVGGEWFAEGWEDAIVAFGKGLQDQQIKEVSDDPRDFEYLTRGFPWPLTEPKLMRLPAA